LWLIALPCHDGLLVIEHNQEQSCQAVKLERAIAAIILVSAFAAPVVLAREWKPAAQPTPH